MKNFYMIGNTHFDHVWLWKWDEAMASIRATFRSALDRMDEDGGFVYSFATPPVFDWIKRTEPKLFDQIKKRVREGRWELAEGWWDQPDCYGASGESYIRQGLYGQRYLKENFGKFAKTVFNIDSFGHSPQLPQILTKSGIDYYCFVRPEKHHIDLPSPYFKWQGIDKSVVLAYRAESAYEKDVIKTAKELGEIYNGNIMIVYGVTDHGGAPTKKSIQDINSREDMKFSTVEDFFSESGEPEHTVTKELTTGDFGPYANGTRIKQLNLLAENAVLNAEKSAVMSERYEDREALTSCWKDIMFNQVHDILGGASIRDAYYDAKNLYGRAISTAEYIMHTNLQMLTAEVKMPGKNPDNAWNLVVWNLNGSEYDGYIEAEVQWAHEFDWYDKSITLEDAEGQKYPCQIIMEKSVVPRFRSRFVFKAKIPSMGYKAFKVVCDGNDAKIINNNGKDPYSIETKLFEIKISEETGAVSYVRNKKTGKCIDSGIVKTACYDDKGDTWTFNIDNYGEFLGEFKVRGAEVLEDGIFRTKIKVSMEYNKSILDFYYIFYENEEYFDLYYKVNWNERYQTLKFEFDVKNDGVTAGVPAGKIGRKSFDGDVPLHRWITFNGISVITPSAFSYSASDDKIGITILRSCIYGDYRMGDIDYSLDFDVMQQGITEGRMRIMFDNEDRVETEAESFINSPIVIDESNHDGKKVSCGSFLSTDCKDISLMALKYGEDDGIIIRLRECKGKGKEKEAKLFFKENTYSLSFTPYEIKTIKLDGKTIKEVNMLEL